VDTRRPYLPSNGTEGMIWTEAWCDKCSRRALDPAAKTQCVHELHALSGKHNGKWLYINVNPECIAFSARNKKRIRKAKDDARQMKLF